MKQLFFFLSFVMLPLTGSAVNVYVRDEGSLQQIMESQYPDVLKHDHSLTIRGHLNVDDINFLRSKMVNDSIDWIEELDLRETQYTFPTGSEGNNIWRLSDFSLYFSTLGFRHHEFFGEGWHYDKENTLRSYMFYQCNRLRRLVLPFTVRGLGCLCVAYCENLEQLEFSYNHLGSLEFPYCFGIQEIRPLAVYHCPKLKEVTLPYFMKTVGSMAFSECDALERVYIKNDVCPPAYGYNCFPHPEKMQLVVVTDKDAGTMYADAPGWDQFGSITTMTTNDYQAISNSTKPKQSEEPHIWEKRVTK